MKKLGFAIIAIMFAFNLTACKKQEAPKQEAPATTEQKSTVETTAGTQGTAAAPAAPATGAAK